jgi:hypothetical protein
VDIAPKPPDDVAVTPKPSEADVRAEMAAFTRKRGVLNHAETHACVDSELMLIWHPPSETSRYVINPLFWQFPQTARRGMPPTMMTFMIDPITQCSV